MSEHVEESFIKTPKQLATVVVLSFVVPIVLCVLIVKLVIDRPTADPVAMTAEAVAARLQPVGKVELGAPSAGGAARSGEEVTKAACMACHGTGAAGAPKLGDKAAWAPRIAMGFQKLVASAAKGKNAMPAKGGDASLSDIELARAVAYLGNQAGASFKEPAAPAAKAPAAK